jgi:DHA1 family tetracycline resistance protein-like MFS transporter
MATANAFMADISRPEEKAQNFGLVSAGFGLGFVLGPAIGGLLALRRLPGVSLLLAVWFFYQVANWVYPSIWPYFTQAAFGWEERMVGLSLAIYGISMVVVQGGLIRLVLPRLGEGRTLLWFLPYNAAVLATVAFVTEGWAMLLLTPFSALGAIAAPALQGLASRLASDDQQGELQGVLASITAVAAILSPLVMTQVFNAATTGGRDFPGASFLIASGLMIAAASIYLLGVRQPRVASAASKT